MPRFVVLLRGVNVGKGSRVPMAELRELLQSLSYTEVATILNSGNAVFTSPGRSSARHAAAIACALKQKLGIVTPVIVKSAAELSAIVAASPFALSETEHVRCLVAFAAEELALAELAPLQALVQALERFVISKAAAYLYCPAGILQSKIAATLLGKAGQRVTTRNWATVLKLVARTEDRAASR
jgi:uncharacterized protein (DUF1697 family)